MIDTLSTTSATKKKLIIQKQNAVSAIGEIPEESSSLLNDVITDEVSKLVSNVKLFFLRH
jgi:hypothetical protein